MKLGKSILICEGLPITSLKASLIFVPEYKFYTWFSLPGPVTQSVVSPTADLGIASLIPTWSHTSWRLIMK